MYVEAVYKRSLHHSTLEAVLSLAENMAGLRLLSSQNLVQALPMK